MKKILALTFLLLATTWSTAFAHTHIASSTPADGDVITTPLQEMTLTFEGKLEAGSTFTLKQDGQDVAVTTAVDDAVLTGTTTEPLTNGAYDLHWNIIGADGHVIEGDIAFTVDAPVEEPAEEPIEQEKAEVTSDVQPTETVEAPQQEKAQASKAPLLIGGGLAIILLLAVVMMRRKK